MEVKGLKIMNTEKKKVLFSCSTTDNVDEQGKWPCGVCTQEGVGNNSILCTCCQKWVHKRCSGVKGISCVRLAHLLYARLLHSRKTNSSYGGRK